MIYAVNVNNVPDAVAECPIKSIPQPRAEPFLHGRDIHALAVGIVIELIFLEIGDHEIVAVRVGEIEAADGRAGVHGEGFREGHAGGGGSWPGNGPQYLASVQ